MNKQQTKEVFVLYSEGSEVTRKRGTMIAIETIQAVFDNSEIAFVDMRDFPLASIVEQLSDGIWVGFYADPKGEWVDAEKLGDTPEEALARAKVLIATNVIKPDVW